MRVKKKKKGGRIGRGINGIASLKPVLPTGTGDDICPHVKVSLAKERDSFTFLSNLVRTSLACLILSPPPKICKAHKRENRNEERSPGDPEAMCCGPTAGWGLCGLRLGYGRRHCLSRNSLC